MNGEIRDGRYVISSTDDHYGPTVIQAVPPTWRDFWSILRGRYKPSVKVGRRLTLKGTNRVIREVWDEKVRDELNKPSPLFEAFKGG